MTRVKVASQAPISTALRQDSVEAAELQTWLSQNAADVRPQPGGLMAWALAALKTKAACPSTGQGVKELKSFNSLTPSEARCE